MVSKSLRDTAKQVLDLLGTIPWDDVMRECVLDSRCREESRVFLYDMLLKAYKRQRLTEEEYIIVSALARYHDKRKLEAKEKELSIKNKAASKVFTADYTERMRLEKEISELKKRINKVVVPKYQLKVIEEEKPKPKIVS